MTGRSMNQVVAQRVRRIQSETKRDNVPGRLLLLCGICLAVCVWRPSLAVSAPHVGYVYKLEGHLNGQSVKYVGSAASLKTRLRDEHRKVPLVAV